MRVRVLPLVFALACVACGSTVGSVNEAALRSGDAGGDDLSLGAETSGAEVLGPAGASRRTTTGGVFLRGSGADGGRPVTAASGGAGVFGRGVRKDKILIGRTRAENAGAANARLGINVAPVPTDQYDKILVDHIKSTGGVGGRMLELVSRIGPGRHYGVGAVRYSSFREDCTWFKYVGDLRPIG